MWRVQVWDGEHIVEAFLFNTESEAIDKKSELQHTYLSSSHRIEMDGFEEEPPKKDNPLLREIIFGLLNPFEWFT